MLEKNLQHRVWKRSNGFGMASPPYNWRSDIYVNPFPNDKFQTLPNSKGLKMAILNLMEMTKSSPEV